MKRIRLAAIAVMVVAALALAQTAAYAFDRNFERFRLRHRTIDSRVFLVVVVKLSLVASQNPPNDCAVGVPVRIQRRVEGRWKTIARGRTNNNSRLRKRVPDRQGRYRAVAPRTTSDKTGFDCFKSVSNVRRHRH